MTDQSDERTTTSGGGGASSEGGDGGGGTGTGAGTGEGDGDGTQRCDYCRLPVPGEAVTAEYGAETYAFCSAGCREALAESDTVFTQYHGFRRTPTGVAPIDESLPQGVPRNSFVVLTEVAGTRSESVRAELVWRALERGEPVVVVTFLEPPVSVVQGFVTLEWNVLPYLEAGQLRFVDAFTHRMEDRERMVERFDDWNTHLVSFCEPATSRVRDPSDVDELASRIDDALERLDMEDRGIVVVDSLDEFGSGVQPVQAYRFVKDLRATVPKSRFVPIYASATVSDDGRGFPTDLDYLVDGIVDLRLNDDLVEGSLLKQLRVRKMSGVLALPKWALYEYTAGEGIVTIDPREGPPDDSADGDGSDGDAGGDSDADA
jgi:KaiC/GvpD/RAD55 family RecA-like ATPase